MHAMACVYEGTDSWWLAPRRYWPGAPFIAQQIGLDDLLAGHAPPVGRPRATKRREA
jgi:hypothetical protein